jgi:fatty acid synthase subunit beta
LGYSPQDCHIWHYIYATLGLDLDYILPFAAVPENGREIDGIDDKSELAHRIMLVNLLRILGAVKNKKAIRHFVTRPTQVILPLSPNHGLFGNDGLYSESKISLETLFNRWNSESWGEYLGLAGAVIGWVPYFCWHDILAYQIADGLAEPG